MPPTPDPLTRCQSLPTPQRVALEVLAAAQGPLTRSALARALGAAGVRLDGRKPTVTSVEPTLDALVATGLATEKGRYEAVPEVAEPLCRRLIDEGRFEERAALAAAVEALPTRSWDWHSVRPGTLLREMRRALVRGDAKSFRELESRWGSGRHLGVRPSLAGWVTDPLDVELLRRLPIDLSALLLDDVSYGQIASLRPIPGLLSLVREVGEDNPEATDFALVVAFEDLLAGDVERARRVLGKPETETALALGGLLALAEGDLKASVRLYARALAERRRTFGKHTLLLSGLEGLLQPLAYLLEGSKSRVGQAARIVERFLETYDVPQSGLHHGIYALARLRALVDGEEPEPVPMEPDHPVSVLLAGLVRHWQAERPDRKRLKAAIERCTACGYAWLAAELTVLLSNDEGAAVPGTVALASHRRRTPPWELRLQALEAAVGETPGGAPAQSRGPRVAWLLQVGRGWIDLVPKEQRPKGKTGWTKGRRIALSRLADDPGSVEGLTGHDRRIAAGLRTEVYSRGWRGYKDVVYAWDSAETWAALVGHPAVFDADEPERRVEVAGCRPRLEVRTTGKDLELCVDPELDEDEAVVVTPTEPGRYEVVAFDPAQLRIAALLADGLTVPRAASGRVGELLSRITSVFEVHDEASASAGSAPVGAADPRLVVQLSPEGDGVRARLVVRPLGEHGPELEPGEGTEALLARVGGEVCRARRDLREEGRRVAALETAAPELVKAAWDGGARCVEDPERTLQLLVELQALGDAVLVEWPEGETFRVRREVGSGALTVSVRAAEDWFSATGRLAVDDDLVLELTELLALVEGSRGRFVRLEDGGFLALTEALRRQLDALARISRTRKGRTEFHGLAAGVVAPLVAGAGRRRTDAAWKAQLRRIEAADAADVPLPNTLQAELRPYQRDGFAWLTRLSTWGAGACLADDMGLGKTVQALALLLTRAAEGPALVVAPASVCGTWCEEAWRFAPSLAVHRFGPGDRKALLDGLGASDVVVCSYGLLTSEVQRLSAVRWATVVLDEAQAIKNPKTRRHRAVLKLSAACRLATTGTPVENHLGELWALFSFLNPGLLGSWERFRTRFAAPIEEGDREVGAQLRQIMLPFILRRTKSAVLAELPPRTDVQITVEPGEAEAALYEALRRRAIEELEAADEEPRPLQILAQLTRLRLACCNPRLVVDHDDAPPSAKLAAFEQIVEGLRASRHRALVFSQFVRHLALLREWLDRRGIPYLYLDGSTPVARRDELVRAFQSGEGELFLISLRAGGLGLNLTGADHVVHMDPWWNPAVEDQASDRAHRIGQTRPVTVYRLVAKGTVEERIVALHHHKRDLADRLLADADTAARLSAADLLAVLRGE